MSGNEVEIFLRDAKSGELQGHVKKRNMATRFLHQIFGRISSDKINTGYVTISNDPTPMNLWKTVIRSTYANAMVLAATTSVNSTARTWTFSASLPPPTAPGRVFQFVGVGVYGESAPSTNARYSSGIFCGTTLSSELTQTNTQTLEIVYRVLFTRL
jgi:hypothetical protein